MRVQLEFLDSTKTRVHTRELEYDATAVPPIPLAGETVSIADSGSAAESATWRVTRREFRYLDAGQPGLVAVAGTSRSASGASWCRSAQLPEGGARRSWWRRSWGLR